MTYDESSAEIDGSKSSVASVDDHSLEATSASNGSSPSEGRAQSSMDVRRAIDESPRSIPANDASVTPAEPAAASTTTKPSEPPQSEEGLDEDDDDGAKRSRKGASGKSPNNLRRLRIERMMSKAELARRANLSVLTIDRIEKGFGCRMDSKRKILEALGLSLADRVRVFGEEE